MVFVNSGYPRFGGMPGNVLLALRRRAQAQAPRVAMTLRAAAERRRSTVDVVAAEDYRRVYAEEGERGIRAI